jgi:hypothetical protein
MRTKGLDGKAMLILLARPWAVRKHGMGNVHMSCICAGATAEHHATAAAHVHVLTLLQRLLLTNLHRQSIQVDLLQCLYLKTQLLGIKGGRFGSCLVAWKTEQWHHKSRQQLKA